MAEINYGQRPLTDFIVQVFDVLSPDEIEKIMSTTKDSDLWRAPGQGDNTTDPQLRNADVLDVSANRDRPEMDAINGMIYGAMEKTISFYRSLHPLMDVRMDTGYEILRYRTGTRCGDHVDSYNGRPRTMTCSIALNHDFEGGEFSILGGQFKTRPRAGTALIFPSNFQYPHEVSPITQGDRYSIITWMI